LPVSGARSMSPHRMNLPRRLAHVALRMASGLCLCFFAAYSGAQQPASFTASSAKPFAQLMDEAMTLMDQDMRRAPMNGQSEHDFIAMMMPHHQGAVNMAKAMLLYTKDPEIRNLALGIITEQQNEIHIMQSWLEHHPHGAGK
jgi:uncharacterized protein (DUF305 family)